MVEEAGKTVREFTGVLKEQTEDKLGIKISSEDVITPWMVRWAAMICSRYLVGKDGRTAYERRRGRKCNLVVVPFGEVVWHREVRRGKQQVSKAETEMRRCMAWACEQHQ